MNEQLPVLFAYENEFGHKCYLNASNFIGVFPQTYKNGETGSEVNSLIRIRLTDNMCDRFSARNTPEEIYDRVNKAIFERGHLISQGWPLQVQK